MGWKLSNPIKSFRDIGSAIIKKPGDLGNWTNLAGTSVAGGWVTTDQYDQEKRKKQAQKEEAQNQAAAKSGFNQGSDMWTKWTGVTEEENAADARQARDIARSRLDQSGRDPISSAIMANKAGAVASAQRNLSAQGIKGPVAQNAVSSIERSKAADANASIYGQAADSLDRYRDIISNSLSGRAKLAFGTAALGQKQPSAPKQSSWIENLMAT